MDTSGVVIQPGAPSGVAVITVDDEVKNELIVVPGANGIVGREDMVRLEAAPQAAPRRIPLTPELKVAPPRLTSSHGVEIDP